MARAVAQSSPVISLGYWQDCCTDSGFTKIMRSTLSAERLMLRTYNASQKGSLVCTATGDMAGKKSGNEEGKKSGDEEREDLGIAIIVHCDRDECEPAKCLTCGGRLEENDTVVCLGPQLCHASCIVCGRCGGAIEPSEEVFVHNNGSSVVCKGCVPKCSACGENVGYNYIHALNKDYHDSCLKCLQCNEVFTDVDKAYAANGEPCCAACVRPVFEEDWSMRDTQEGQKDKHIEGYPPRDRHFEPESKIKKSRTFSTNTSLLSRALSTSMASLTSSIGFASPLTAGPSSTNAGYSAYQNFVLNDKRGLSLLKSFCVKDCSVELLAFWMDIEHFRQLRRTSAELIAFGHQIMLKYIGYYAELPLGLPKGIEDHITSRIHQDFFTNDVFNEAQQFVCRRLENEVLPRFFESEDGQNYLKTVNLTPEMLTRGSCDSSVPIKARVVDCDKRRLGSKYYVYEIDVEMGDEKYTVYRRFSEFNSLHDRMKVTFSTRVLPTLPKKIYFGRSQVRTVAKQRMKDLEIYIQGLLKSPAFYCSMELRRFLSQTETDKEDEAFNKKIQKLQTS